MRHLLGLYNTSERDIALILQEAVVFKAALLNSPHESFSILRGKTVCISIL
jgi:aspartate carbamoyltransferase catalytic subunit